MEDGITYDVRVYRTEVYKGAKVTTYLGTYWAQRPAYGHPEPYTVARGKIGLELSLASSRASQLVVAGPGFEPG